MLPNCPEFLYAWFGLNKIKGRSRCRSMLRSKVRSSATRSCNPTPVVGDRLPGTGNISRAPEHGRRKPDIGAARGIRAQRRSWQRAAADDSLPADALVQRSHGPVGRVRAYQKYYRELATILHLPATTACRGSHRTRPPLLVRHLVGWRWLRALFERRPCSHLRALRSSTAMRRRHHHRAGAIGGCQAGGHQSGNFCAEKQLWEDCRRYEYTEANAHRRHHSDSVEAARARRRRR